MAAARRLTTSALFFTALAVATTACGTSGSSTHPPAASLSPAAVSDPLAGWSVQRIVKQSAADSLAARYVGMTGTGSDSGHHVAYELTTVAGVGCRGTITEQGLGSFTLAGKYLEDKAGTGLGSLASMCSMHSLVGNDPGASSDNTVKRAGTAVIDGQRALKFTSVKEHGTVYVSDTAKPEFLQMAISGSGGGTASFTYYTTAPAITPPPASEVIDGSKYGF
jgi:hypothetical protein